MATRYNTKRPDKIIPLLPDAPTDIDWSSTTTWDAWATYISQRGKWAGGIECRALNEVFAEIGSRSRINFISHNFQKKFGTELNSANTNEILLLLRSGHFQLLLPTNLDQHKVSLLKHLKRNRSKPPSLNINKRKLKCIQSCHLQPPRAKRPRVKKN